MAGSPWRLRPTYAEQARCEAAGRWPLPPPPIDPHTVVRPFAGDTSGADDVPRPNPDAALPAQFGGETAAADALVADYAGLVAQSVGPPRTEAATPGRAAVDVVARYLQRRFDTAGTEERVDRLLAPFRRPARRAGAVEVPGRAGAAGVPAGVSLPALQQIILRLRAD